MEHSAYIVTEGESEAVILRTIMPELTSTPDKFRIIVGGGYSSALAAAHTVLTSTHKPALLLIDADTNDDQRIDERKQFVEEYVNSVSQPQAFCKVVMAVPTVEALFFVDKALLEEALGKKISDEIWGLAQYSPSRALDLVSGNHRLVTLRRLLSNDNIRRSIGQTPTMNEIRSFLQAA